MTEPNPVTRSHACVPGRRDSHIQRTQQRDDTRIRLRRSSGVAIVSWSVGFGPPQVRGEPVCRVVQQEKRIELRSPFFAFRLDVAALRAASWENPLIGRKLALGNGPELTFDIGLTDKSALRDPHASTAGGRSGGMLTIGGSPSIHLDGCEGPSHGGAPRVIGPCLR